MLPPRVHARALVVTLVATCALQLALASPVAARLWKVTAPDSTVDPLVKLGEYEKRIAFLVNQERVNADRKPVRFFETCVDRTSERWSVHLGDTGKLVHRDLTKVLAHCQLHWVGETLVRGTSLQPGPAVDAWMASPSHRAVLLKPRARLAGVGTRIDSRGRYVTVLNFGDRS